jgi:hypothetical protein
VPLPLGLDGELLGDDGLPLGGVVEVPGDVDGEVDVGGDADGVRSPGRSPTRSVGDSVQAVSMPTLSARAPRPVSILFMSECLLSWVVARATYLEGRLQPVCRCPLGAATDVPSIS